MNQQWRTFLESQSAIITESDEVSFEKGNQLTECALFDLSYLKLTNVSGEDAVTFLQGQFTNDVREVSPQHHQMSGYCTPKGRMLANFRIFSHNDAYVLQTPADTSPELLKRLSMFVLRSQVSIEDISDRLVAIGLAGSCSEKLLMQNFRSVPTTPGDAIEENGVSLLCLPGPAPRYEIIGQPSDIKSLWKGLSDKTVLTDSEIWKLLDIQAGVPTVYSETVESFVPQMLNMQLIDGVSFDKGCYVGQEVVARMKYLGMLKRRMYLAKVNTDRPPQPGDELFSDTESESGQGAGRVVMSAKSPQGGYELLAVIETTSYQGKKLHLEHASGPILEFLPMPYDLGD